MKHKKLLHVERKKRLSSERKNLFCKIEEKARTMIMLQKYVMVLTQIIQIQ